MARALDSKKMQLKLTKGTMVFSDVDPAATDTAIYKTGDALSAVLAENVDEITKVEVYRVSL